MSAGISPPRANSRVVIASSDNDLTVLNDGELVAHNVNTLNITGSTSVTASGTEVSVAIPDAGSATSIENLMDVTVTDPTADQVLVYDVNTATWVNDDQTGGDGATTLEALTDVEVSGATDGQSLVYNATTDTWGPFTVSGGGGGATNLNALTDVVITDAVSGEFLRYDGTTWNNVVISIPGAVSGGTGITVTNDVISISDNGVGTTQIADSAITTDKIADNAVGRTELNLTNTGTDGQILSRAGDTFTWVDDNSGNAGNTLIAGEHISLTVDGSNTTIAVEEAYSLFGGKADFKYLEGSGAIGNQFTYTGHLLTFISNYGSTVNDLNLNVKTGQSLQITRVGTIIGTNLSDSVTNNYSVLGKNVDLDGMAIDAIASDGESIFREDDAQVAYTYEFTLLTLTNAGGDFRNLDLEDFNDVDETVVAAEGDTLIWNATTSMWTATGLPHQDWDNADLGNLGDGSQSYSYTTSNPPASEQFYVNDSNLGEGYVLTFLRDDVDTKNLVSVRQFRIGYGSPIQFATYEVSLTAFGTEGSGDDEVDVVMISLVGTPIDGNDILGTLPANNTAASIGVSYNEYELPELSELTDVSTTVPTNDQVLTWNATTSVWEPQASQAGGATVLGGLNDVTITSPADNQFVRYDSGTSQWVNETVVIPTDVPTDLSDLDDVSDTAATAGQNLTWSGSEWAPADPVATADWANADFGAIGTGPQLINFTTDGIPAAGQMTIDPSNGNYEVTFHQDNVQLTTLQSVRAFQIGYGNPIAFATYEVSVVAVTTEGTDNTPVVTLSIVGGPIAGDDILATPPSNGTGVSIGVTTNGFAQPNLGDLPDVSSTSPTTGQNLTWSGSEWAPADATGGGATSLNGLTDVHVGFLEDGYLLRYDDGDSRFETHSVNDTLRAYGGIDVDQSTGFTIPQGTGTHSVAIGNSAVASAESATVVGDGAHASHENSASFGVGATASGNNDVRLGDANAHVTVDATLAGTEAFDNQLATVKYVKDHISDASRIVSDSTNGIQFLTRANETSPWGDYLIDPYLPDATTRQIATSIHYYDQSDENTNTFFPGVFQRTTTTVDQDGGSDLTNGTIPEFFEEETMVQTGNNIGDIEGNDSTCLGWKYVGYQDAKVWMNSPVTIQTQLRWVNHDPDNASIFPPQVGIRMEFVRMKPTPFGSNNVQYEIDNSTNTKVLVGTANQYYNHPTRVNAGDTDAHDINFTLPTQTFADALTGVQDDDVFAFRYVVFFHGNEFSSDVENNTGISLDIYIENLGSVNPQFGIEHVSVADSLTVESSGDLVYTDHVDGTSAVLIDNTSGVLTIPGALALSDVDGGNGIDVTGKAVSVTVNNTGGLEVDTNGIAVKTSTGLSTSASGLALNAGINNLTDVDTVSKAPAEGQHLTWDNTDNLWVPGDSVTTLANLTDTSVVSPTVGQILQWDGSDWANTSLSGTHSFTAGAGLNFNTDGTVLNTNLPSIGINVNTDGSGSNTASASGTDGIAIGAAANCSGARSVAIGNNNNAIANDTLAIGPSANSAQAHGIALGDSTVSTTADGDTSGIAIGERARVSATHAIAIGSSADPDSVTAQRTFANADHSIAMGTAAQASGTDSVSIGTSTRASGNQSIALGDTPTASGSYSMAIGGNATASSINGIAVGRDSVANATNSVAVGRSADAGGDSAAAFGTTANASGGSSVAVGHNAAASALNTIAIGTNSVADVANTAVIGSGDDYRIFAGSRELTLSENVSAGAADISSNVNNTFFTNSISVNTTYSEDLKFVKTGASIVGKFNFRLAQANASTFSENDRWTINSSSDEMLEAFGQDVGTAALAIGTFVVSGSAYNSACMGDVWLHPDTTTSIVRMSFRVRSAIGTPPTFSDMVSMQFNLVNF